jgi:hypothetical protein
MNRSYKGLIAVAMTAMIFNASATITTDQYVDYELQEFLRKVVTYNQYKSAGEDFNVLCHTELWPKEEKLYRRPRLIHNIQVFYNNVSRNAKKLEKNPAVIVKLAGPFKQSLNGMLSQKKGLTDTEKQDRKNINKTKGEVIAYYKGLFPQFFKLLENFEPKSKKGKKKRNNGFSMKNETCSESGSGSDDEYYPKKSFKKSSKKGFNNETASSGSDDDNSKFFFRYKRKKGKKKGGIFSRMAKRIEERQKNQQKQLKKKGGNETDEEENYYKNPGKKKKHYYGGNYSSNRINYTDTEDGSDA